MDFLKLCKKVRQITGISGDGPATVIGQKGIMQRVVSWVLDAEENILMIQDDWQFMRSYSKGSLVAGSYRYPVSVLEMQPTKKVNAAYINGRAIQFIDYAKWLDNVVEYGDTTVTGEPKVATLTPDQNLQFWPVPIAVADVTVDYYRRPTAMSVNTSVSDIPAMYHQAIVHRALMFYADYEEDMYRYQRSQVEFDKWLAQILVDQLPKSEFARDKLYG